MNNMIITAKYFPVKNLKKAVLRVMEQEEEEIERNINNITCDTSFESPVTMNLQKKDANFSWERRLAAGVLAEIVENFKGCTIQSDKQVDKIIDFKEHVDARNWLRNDSAEQVDEISNSKKNWLWIEAIQKAIQG